MGRERNASSHEVYCNNTELTSTGFAPLQRRASVTARMNSESKGYVTSTGERVLRVPAEVLYTFSCFCVCFFRQDRLLTF